MRITAACPKAMTSKANNLAMCLGQSAADGLTFANVTWQDASGNLYACASFVASDEWIAAAQQPLVRPAWDTDEIIDMDAAARAQAALVFSMEPTGADPQVLTAIGGMEGPDAVTSMGLTKVSEEA